MPDDSRSATQRRLLRRWAFYDFGNSAFAILFPAFYGVNYATQVVGGRQGDLRWGQAVSLSMLLVALAGPLLGGLADRSGRRKRFLVFFTVLGVSAVLSFAAIGPGDVLVGFLAAVVANLAFEAGTIFYNAYLPDLAPAAAQGRASALGFAFGYAGSLVALALAAVLWGLTGSLGLVWMALAVQWLLGAFVSLRALPRDGPSMARGLGSAVAGFRETWRTLGRGLRHRPLLFFLLAHFLSMNGVLTVIHFASLYARETLVFTTREILVLLALVQATALLGSLVGGKMSDRFGPRVVLALLFLWWTLVVAGAAVAHDKALFLGIGALAGLGLGSVQSVARALMARLIPEGEESRHFGFYALCGKGGAILGPLLFGVVAVAWNDQRPAVLSTAVFFAAGLFFLGRMGPLPEDRRSR